MIESGYKSRLHKYLIWLYPYSNTFQISANHLSAFDEEAFRSQIKYNDTFTITIPAYQEKNINTEDKVFITSIKVNNKFYLKPEDVFSIETSFMSRYGDYCIGLMWLMIGIFKYFKYKRKRY